MSVEFFQAYNVHLVHREALAQHKSVLLKNPQVLQLVCDDLNIDHIYHELLYAAQKGHLLLRVRPSLQHCNPGVRSGLVAVLNKQNFNPIKLLGVQNREPAEGEVKHINQLISTVFRS